MSIDEYLGEIGASGIITEKVKYILKLAKEILPQEEDIQKIFLSNIKIKDTINFSDLWIFTKNFMLESREILSDNNNIDIVSYREIISTYDISLTNFDVFNKKIYTNSKISLDGVIQNSVFELSAVEKNCTYLWEIIQNHIIPNILYFPEEK